MSVWRVGDKNTNIGLTSTGALKVRVVGNSFYPEVANFSALPTASDYSGKIYVALAAEGVWLVNRKQSGMYYSNGSAWSHLGDTPAFFNADNFRVYDNGDNTKNLKYDVSGITTATTRTYTWPDKNGTVAMTSDITGGGGATADHNIIISAGAARRDSTSYPEYFIDTSDNDTEFMMFDTTATEYEHFQDYMPTDINTSATCTVLTVGRARTYATGTNNIAWLLEYMTAGNSGALPQTYATLASGDLTTTTAGQDSIDIFTFEQKIATMGIQQGNFVKFRWSKSEASANNHPNDYGYSNLRLTFPRS
jgi:hypothetical protein